MLLVAGWAAVVAAIIVSGYGAAAAKDGYLRADAGRQVELANQDFLIGMVNQETGLRGYVITSDPANLATYNLGGTEVTDGTEATPRDHQGPPAPGGTERVHCRVRGVAVLGGPAETQRRCRGK